MSCLIFFDPFVQDTLFSHIQLNLIYFSLLWFHMLKKFDTPPDYKPCARVRRYPSWSIKLFSTCYLRSTKSPLSPVAFVQSLLILFHSVAVCWYVINLQINTITLSVASLFLHSPLRQHHCHQQHGRALSFGLNFWVTEQP